MPPKVYTTVEVSKETRIPRATLQDWIANGYISPPPIRPLNGRNVRLWTEVEAQGLREFRGTLKLGQKGKNKRHLHPLPFAADTQDGTEMIEITNPTAGEIISAFRGVYARVAKKLKVSESFVSKVANGERLSMEIDAALRAELQELKKRLASYS